MVDDADNVPEGKLVIIASNDADNGDVYIKIPGEFRWVTKISGAQGIRGEQGIQGIPGTDGQDGQDGVTPHIDSQSGHWFIGDTDTGVKA